MAFLINFYKAINLNILLYFTEKYLNEYLKDIDNNGIIIADASIEIEYSDYSRFCKIPIVKS